MPDRTSPPRLSDYVCHVTDVIRFGDQDPQGHVNNAVFATFFESGRVGLSHDPKLGFRVPGAGFMLARVVINYLGELRWPGQVTIGTRVQRLGRTSLTFDHAVFSGERCVAAGESTVVLVDGATHKPRPWPEDVAAKISATITQTSG